MKQLIAELRADTGAYDALGKWYKQPGYWIVAIHRLGCWAKRLPWWGRVPSWVVYRLLHLSYHAFNIELWAGERGGHPRSRGCVWFTPTTCTSARK
jgi:hypothetical protein